MKKVIMSFLSFSLFIMLLGNNVYADDVVIQNSAYFDDERICNGIDDSIKLQEDSIYSESYMMVNENIKTRSYVRTAKVIQDLLNPNTDEYIASAIVEFEYEYADGLWAQIRSAKIRHEHIGGYEMSAPYGQKFSSDSESGTFGYYFNISHNGRVAKYYCCVACTIYGDIEYDLVLCGVQ